MKLLCYRKYQICRLLVQKANSSPERLFWFLLTSEMWLDYPLPLALLLLLLESCSDPSLHWSWWLDCHFSAPSLKRIARKPRPGWSWQWNLALGGFFSRFSEALMLEVRLEWPHPFPRLLSPAHRRALMLQTETLCLVKWTFFLGTADLSYYLASFSDYLFVLCWAASLSLFSACCGPLCPQSSWQTSTDSL